MSAVGMEWTEVRTLFADRQYTTNAIGDAFKGATRTDVLLLMALMDCMAERTATPTWDNAMALNAAVKAIVAQLTEARKDSARLEWLERVQPGVEIEKGYARLLYEVDVAPDGTDWTDECTKGPTLRAAIDAAMAKESPRA